MHYRGGTIDCDHIQIDPSQRTVPVGRKTITMHVLRCRECGVEVGLIMPIPSAGRSTS